MHLLSVLLFLPLTFFWNPINMTSGLIKFRKSARSHLRSPADITEVKFGDFMLSKEFDVSFFSCLRAAQRIWPIQILLQPLLLLTLEIIKLNGAVMVCTKTLCLGKSCGCSCGAAAWGDVLRGTKTYWLWCRYKTCHMLREKCESLEVIRIRLLLDSKTAYSERRCYPVVVTNWVVFLFFYTGCASHLLLAVSTIKY